MTITEELVENKQEEIELTAKDRCDSCGAQAFVYVKGLSGELYFCGHHYAKNEEKLKSTVLELQASGVNAFYEVFDVGNYEDVKVGIKNIISN